MSIIHRSLVRRLSASALSLALVVPSAAAQNQKKAEKPAVASAADPNAVDYDALTRIRWEAFHNSKVMETLGELTDRFGPRLTNSPNEKRASAWAKEQLTKWGMENVHSEPWGPFGPGWSYEVSELRMIAPDTAELIALPKAWSRGTEGVLRGKVVRTKITSVEDFAKYKGKLAGAIVLNGDVRKLPLDTEAKSERYTDKTLGGFAEFPIPEEREDPLKDPYTKRMRFLRQFTKFLEEEKVAALLEGSRAPFDGGTLNVQGNGRAYRQGEPIGPPMLSLAIEHFNRMARLADRGVPVEVEMNVKTTFYPNNGDINGYNVVAEIPGSDPQLKDQVVMLGAHLDSWHGATGATDNAAGSAVMMEAMRILKATRSEER